MRRLLDLSAEDVFDELFKLAPEKVNAVKEVREIKAPSHSPARLPRVLGGAGEGARPSLLTCCASGAMRGALLSPPQSGRRKT